MRQLLQLERQASSFLRPRVYLLPFFLLLSFFIYAIVSDASEFLARSAPNVEDSVGEELITRRCGVKDPHPNCKPASDLQFDKFVFVFSDGFPRVLSDRIFDEYRQNSVAFIVDVPGIKLSHAIFLSFFTGQPDVRFWASRVMTDDNIFDSLFRSDQVHYDVVYHGKELCLMDLIGRKRRKRFHHEVIIDESKTMKVHDVFFETPTSAEKFLDEAKEQGTSLFLYSAIYDSRQHKYGWDSTTMKAVGDELVENLLPLRKWIDEHPEYLLVLGSDHGFDGFGNLIHGNTMPGNQGYILLYNPRLPTLKENHEQHVDVVDVAPTLMTYLRGADIPFRSVGEARTDLGSDGARWSIMWQNLEQLRDLAKSEGFEVEDMDTSAMSSTELLENIHMWKEVLMMTSSLDMFSMSINIIALLVGGIFLIRSGNVFSFKKHAFEKQELANTIIDVIKSVGILLIVYVFFFHPGISIGLWHMHLPDGLETDLCVMLSFIQPAISLVMLALTRSDPSITSMVVKSEGINVALQLIARYIPRPMYNDMFQGIPGIFFYAAWGIMFRKSFYHLFMIGLMVLYEWTTFQGMYFLFYFHPLALGVYGMVGFTVYRSFRMGFRATRDEISATFLLLFTFLWPSAPEKRFFLFIAVYQLRSLTFPMLQGVSKLYGKARGRRRKTSIALQIVIVSGFLQIIQHFTVGLGYDMSINVDPFSGKIGLLNFDVFPFFSAFLMGVSKLGMVFLSTLEYFDEVLLHVEGNSNIPHVQAHAMIPAVIISVHVAITNIALHEIVWRYMLPGKLSDFMVNALVMCFLGIAMCVRLLWWTSPNAGDKKYDEKTIEV